MNLSSFFDQLIMDDLYAASGSSANVANDRPSLTAEGLLANFRRLQAMVADVAPPPPPSKIVECAWAVMNGQRVKTYPRRKAKTPAHWRRMDKKWMKRYGFKQQPCVFTINGDALELAFGMRQSTVFMVHPSLMRDFMAQFDRTP